MEIGIDQNQWLPAQPAAGEVWRPEWQSLKARFSAAHAMRCTLAAGAAANGAPAGGSFDRGSARLVADFGQSLDPVNPTASRNSKPTQDKDGSVAIASDFGGRGTQ